MIDHLINKRDSFEIIREQIAAILALEIDSQKNLAIVEGLDPQPWDLLVFSERANPWEIFLNDPERAPSRLVNVWYEESTFEQGGSNISERQKTTATFNIDCYGYGQAQNHDGAGHIAGDREAALEVQRALMLVRNILMAATHTYLGLQGLVWQRWIRNTTVFQPQAEARAVQQIVGARLNFQVVFNEFSPQVTPVELELLSAKVYRVETGQIILNADYLYPLPDQEN